LKTKEGGEEGRQLRPPLLPPVLHSQRWGLGFAQHFLYLPLKISPNFFISKLCFEILPNNVFVVDLV
jgi:hypothetical protein